MIVITGGEGFIGKNLVEKLQEMSNLEIIVLDTKTEDLDSIYNWLEVNVESIDIIFHFGALTNTKESDYDKLTEYNIVPSMFIWNFCVQYDVPLIYASSAATYGDGKQGFDDEEKDIFNLKPLNPYGESKQKMDEWVTTARFKPSFWYGLKFFNVYGYGEEHKDDMASVVLHFYNQIKETGGVKLFKSHREDVVHGEQKRDFVYIDDVIDVCIHFMNEKPFSGIYNVGTGKARSYNDLAKAVFKSLGYEENISYIDTPLSIRSNYQYFTEANIKKLRNVAKYRKPFQELEDGVFKYVNKLKE